MIKHILTASFLLATSFNIAAAASTGGGFFDELKDLGERVQGIPSKIIHKIEDEVASIEGRLEHIFTSAYKEIESAESGARQLFSHPVTGTPVAISAVAGHFYNYIFHKDHPDREKLDSLLGGRVYTAPPEHASNLPEEFSLTTHINRILDQGQLGSCTAHALTQSFEIKRDILKEIFIALSRKDGYTAEMVFDGQHYPFQDNGSTLTTAAHIGCEHGLCPESENAYTDNITKYKTETSTQKKDALKHRVTSPFAWSAVNQTATDIKSSIFSGHPVMVGFDVLDYDGGLESDQVAQTGVMTAPPTGANSLGGHAVTIAGWKLIDGKTHYIIGNSWGGAWGGTENIKSGPSQGFFYVPEEVILNGDIFNDFRQIGPVK